MNAAPTVPISWADLDLPVSARVAIVAPHSDDFDEIGVTLKWLAGRGHPVFLAVLTTANGVEDSYCAPQPPTPAVKAAIRRQEQQRSCAFFGLPPERLEFPVVDEDAEWQPLANDRNAGVIREFLQRVRADLVFLPHGHDTNPGHQRTFALVREVAAHLEQPLTACYIRDPKTIACRTDVYLGFDETAAAWKAELLRFHDSQQQRNLRTRGRGFDWRILEVNRQIARELKLPEPYAEAFELERF